jgi:N-acetylglucosaminyldiphosphoundecaprenol N-acetyl-beta-D-mannosaminyltransferase
LKIGHLAISIKSIFYMKKDAKAVSVTAPKSHKFAEILGVPVNSSLTSQVLEKVESDIKLKHKFTIVTPNPEIVMLAQNDEELKAILNKADISIADGIGLVAAQKFISLPVNSKVGWLGTLHKLFLNGWKVGKSIMFDREWLEKDLKVIRGRELFLELIKLADKNSWKIYLLGGEGTEARGTKLELEKYFTKIKIMSSSGPILFNDGNPKTKKDGKEEIKVVSEINNFSPELLFVGFGAPKQEKWMYRLLPKLSVGGVMVVGGTFKYVSGKAKLPPRFVVDLGLEWLWRYLTGNQKGERIKSAVWQFPLKVFASKLFAKS